MTEIFNEVAILGVDLSNEDRVVYLLASLPESYNTLVTALEAHADVPEMEVVTERLLNEERKQKDRETVSNKEQAYMVRKPQGKVAHSSIKSYRCHKFGHIQRNCPEAERSTAKTQFKGNKKSNGKLTVNSAELAGRRESTESSLKSCNEFGLVTNHLLSAKSESHETARRNDYWIIDSGAICHICNNKELFTNLVPTKKPQSIVLGDGRQLEVNSYRTVKLQLVLQDGVTRQHLTIANVLFVPSLAYNLLSVSKLTDTGNRMTFFEDQCMLKDLEGRVVMIAHRDGNLYYLNNHVNHTHLTCTREKKSKLWHRRFRHLSEGNLEILARNQMVEGLTYNDIGSASTGVCEPCVAGKLHKAPFPHTERRRARDSLDIVHSDVCGKLENKSLGGAEYFLTFIDDKTHYTWVYVLKRKSEVFQKFQEWKEWWRRSQERN